MVGDRLGERKNMSYGGRILFCAFSNMNFIPRFWLMKKELQRLTSIIKQQTVLLKEPRLDDTELLQLSQHLLSRLISTCELHRLKEDDFY